MTSYLKHSIRAVLALMVLLPAQSAWAACASPTGAEGDIIYNSTHNMMQFCDDTDWIAMAGTSSGGGGATDCPIVQATYMDSTDGTYGVGVWQQGPYTFLTQNENQPPGAIFADNAAGTRVGTYAFPGGREPIRSSLWGDGTYVYVGAGNYLYAFTFDGTNFTAVSANTGQPVYDIWGDGTYIYIANGTAGIEAWTFNGTTLTQAGSTYNTAGTAESIWANATHQFAVDSASNLMAFTFNGTAFTLVDSTGSNGCCGFNIVTGDSNYIYAANFYAGSEVYTLTGSTLNYIMDVGQVYGAQDGYLYTKVNGAVEVFSFDGATATYQGAYALSGAGELYDLNVGDDGNVYTMGAFGPTMSFAECAP